MEDHSTHIPRTDIKEALVEPTDNNVSQIPVSSNENEERSRICSRCMEIDFDQILAPGFVVANERRLICKLDYIYNEGQEECDLCSLFRSTNWVTDQQRGISPTTLIAYTPANIFQLHLRNFDTDALCSAVLRVDSPDRDMYNPPSHPLCDPLSPSILPTNIDSLVHGRNTSDGVDWTIIKSWLHFCDTHHMSCRGGSHMKSLRVIDCNTQKLVDLANPCDKYVTLSYVWGKSAECSGTTGATLDIIPTLIADTICVVQSLGLRYLWVDRYCIPQDDEGKHALIQNMGNIYSNSKLTIIAACCEDPSWGLPGVASRRRKKQPSAQVGAHSLVSIYFDVGQELRHSVWNTRGWTYQEALLSKRRLVFGESQTYFQCSKMYRYEAIAVKPCQPRTNTDLRCENDYFEMNNPTEVIFPVEGIGRSVSDIGRRIEEYYVRKLLYPSDKLNAFNGILETFEIKFKMRNLCGLPLPIMPLSSISKSPCGDLLTGLQWTFESQLWSYYSVLKRIEEFPSWSWVGWATNNGSIVQRGLLDLDQISWPQTRHYGCRNVDVEFQDRNKLRWPGDRNRILNYGATSSRPRWLHFRSWTATFTGIMSPTFFSRHGARLGTTGIQGMTMLDAQSVFKFGDPSHEYNANYCHANEIVGLLGIVLGTDRYGLTIMAVLPKTGANYYEFAGCYDLYWPSYTDWILSTEGPRRGVACPLPFRNLDVAMDNQSISYDGIEFTLKDIKVG